MSSNLDKALSYAKRGWAVFPLSPFSKIPLISREKGGKGVHDATTNLDKITEWWTCRPTANVGIACGAPSGIVVIDIDPKNGGDKSVERLSQKGCVFPTTLTTNTPNGGQHLYYKYEPWIVNSSKALGIGIDIQSAGKPITAPPSKVRNLSSVIREYTWVDETAELAPLPSWMRRFSSSRPSFGCGPRASLGLRHGDKSDRV